MNHTDIFSSYPQGWFAVCFTFEIKPKQAKRVYLMGKELVLWQSEQGAIALADAYCPHLGTHLGHCGEVHGERLFCPFHGLTFDEHGACSAKVTNDKLRLKTYPVVVQNNIIFSCFDSLSPFSEWLPHPVDTHSYTKPKTAIFKIHSTPHEITENTVDLKHFSALHHYHDPKIKYHANGQYMNVQTFIKRKGGLFGKTGLVNINTDTHHYGLGYANVNITLPSLDLHFTGFVLPTPIDNHHIELRFMLMMKKITNPSKINPILSIFPKKWLTHLLFWQSFRGFVMNVAEDLPIWEHKTYLAAPNLTPSDGPIPFYRNWADQFYQDNPLNHIGQFEQSGIEERHVELNGV